MKSIFRFDPNLLCRGTEEFYIPALVAALGTGAQAVNQSNANSRAQNAEVQAINNQQQMREQANSQVKGLTSQVAQNNPQQIAAKEQGDFINTLRQNEAGKNQSTNYGQSTSALAPAVGANSRYNADVANSSQQVQDYGNKNAGEMSAIDAAVRQRQNEGLAMQTLGTNLNTLQANSQMQGFVDQLRAQTAGQASPWVNLFGQVLKQGASAYAKNAGGDYSGWTPKVGNSAPSTEFTNTINPNLPGP